jgi:hypothetical protein
MPHSPVQIGIAKIAFGKEAFPTLSISGDDMFDQLVGIEGML